MSDDQGFEKFRDGFMPTFRSRNNPTPEEYARAAYQAGRESAEGELRKAWEACELYYLHLEDCMTRYMVDTCVTCDRLGDRALQTSVPIHRARTSQEART